MFWKPCNFNTNIIIRTSQPAIPTPVGMIRKSFPDTKNAPGIIRIRMEPGAYLFYIRIIIFVRYLNSDYRLLPRISTDHPFSEEAKHL